MEKVINTKGEGGKIVEGQIDEGHGDSTQPAGIDSPATYTPLATSTSSVNTKTELGRRGPKE